MNDHHLKKERKKGIDNCIRLILSIAISTFYSVHMSK